MATDLDVPADPIPPVHPRTLARSAAGGVLMGLANLVPGISGGTMLLATGVYTGFINAIAELTTLRIRLRSLVLLGVIGAAAGLAIASLAGPTKSLVVHDRWIMYSLFIGLTLGGVPIVWRLARPATPPLWIAAALAFAVMVVMALAEPGGGATRSYPLLFLSGTAGASAMILPGISGGYLLLLLGQYVPILGAIDQLKTSLLDTAAALRDGSLGLGQLFGSSQLAPALDALHVVIPVGIGVVIGVVGVSNAVRWLLEHYSKITLGALLGLLVGAVVGLWPFQEGVAPRAGDRLHGHVLSVESAALVAPDEWPVVFFRPTAGQLAGSLGLMLAGLAATSVVAWLGDDGSEEPGESQS